MMMMMMVMMMMMMMMMMMIMIMIMIMIMMTTTTTTTIFLFLRWLQVFFQVEVKSMENGKHTPPKKKTFCVKKHSCLGKYIYN